MGVVPMYAGGEGLLQSRANMYRGNLLIRNTYLLGSYIRTIHGVILCS